MSYPFQNSAKSENLSFQPPLANNIRNVATLINKGFQKNLLSDIENNQDKYHQNVDALSFGNLSKKSIYVESYFLSSIVADIEFSNTDLCPNENGIYPRNCGKKIMPVKLQNKIHRTNKDVSKDSAVDIVKYKNSYSYQNLMQCNNVWGCPICSRKLSEKRKNGLVKLLKSHFSKYGDNTAIMLLFTVPHGLGDDLPEILNRISKAYRFMIQSDGYKKIVKKYGNRGTSRNLEVTYGFKNGFHPHLHTLNFFSKSVLDNLDELSDEFFMLWSKALARYGFSEPSKKGFGCEIIENSAGKIEAISEYVAKVESNDDNDFQNFQKHYADAVKNNESSTSWGASHELTKWHLKKGSNQNGDYHYSMFDFLRGYSIASQNDDEESKNKFYSLWLTYRKAFKGKRQLFTKHQDFKISELLLSDEELGDENPEDNVAKLVVSIPFDIWKLVVMMKARGTVLESVRRKGEQGFIDAIKLLKLGYDSLPEHKRILQFAEDFEDGYSGPRKTDS